MSTRETKREKFQRLAEIRTNAVLEKIRVLANCANTATYEYEESDVRAIFNAIEAELKLARSQFRSAISTKKFEFPKTEKGF